MADDKAVDSGYDHVTTQEVAQISVERVRLTFGATMLAGFVLGILVKIGFIQWITKWGIQNGGQCTTEECIGVQGVTRVSFALFLFFFVHWLASSPWNLCLSPKQRVAFNSGNIIVKFIVLGVLTLISFAIPSGFFVVYGWLCLVLSVLFLIGQLVILLDCSYKWSDKWAEDEDSKYQVGLLVCTVAMTIGAITIVVLSFVWFGYSSVCGLEQAMTTVVALSAVIYYPLSIWSRNGSILPSATIFVYTAWTCFTALSQTDSHTCNKIYTGTGVVQLVLGTCISAISLVYTTVNAGTSRAAFSIDSTEDETVEEAEAASFSFFHMQMMLGACYLAMLLSGWSILGSEDMATVSGGDSAPMWAKFTSVLVCIALYGWSLIAPHVCADREFV